MSSTEKIWNRRFLLLFLINLLVLAAFYACKNKILDKDCNIYKQGKNWYCEIDHINRKS